MATYFDRREQREKPEPDCSAHGLVWDPGTQRCENRGAWLSQPSEGLCDGPLSDANRPTGLGPLIFAGALLWLFFQLRK